MQEMRLSYAERLGKKYKFLIYEYPFRTTGADEQVDFAAKLLKALSIEKVILIGASDGGIYALFVYQLFVPALLNDAPIYNKYLIRVANGFKSVSDHNNRFVARECFDRLLQSVLVFGGDVCRRLVKNDDRCILSLRRAFPQLHNCV